MAVLLFKWMRERWHPLWRLRQRAWFRALQRRCDRTIFTQLPGTGLRVAVRALRDASWWLAPDAIEPALRAALPEILASVQPRVFWDVGANIGSYAWLVRQHPSVREVILIEADPLNARLIEKTIGANHLDDCRLIAALVADHDGEADFLVDAVSGATGGLASTSKGSAANVLHAAYGLGATTRRQAMRLDTLLDRGFAAPDLMKIDVEGAEHLVLAGAERLLREKRPALILETANDDLLDQLRALGYTARPLDAENWLLRAEP